MRLKQKQLKIFLMNSPSGKTSMPNENIKDSLHPDHLFQGEKMSGLKESTKNFAMGFCFGMIILIICATVYLLRIKTDEYNRGEKHVRAMINKNCNDCHIGKNFINLFQSEFLKNELANDNSVFIGNILTVSKLKMY